MSSTTRSALAHKRDLAITWLALTLASMTGRRAGIRRRLTWITRIAILAALPYALSRLLSVIGVPLASDGR